MLLLDKSISREMRAAIIVSACVLFGLAQARITYLDVLQAEFTSFKAEHQKDYGDEFEEKLRLQIFMNNKNLIDKHNARYARGEETFTMGVNQFTDWLPSEFQSRMLSTLNASDMAADIDFTYAPPDVEAPSNVDWRAKGALTAVKNQGSCGSCWAFAAAGVLESQLFLRTRQLVPLSEQNLIDCSSRYNNHGCNGGWPASALRYIKDNHGIDLERAYPYEGRNGMCRFNRGKVGARVANVIQVRPNENALAQAVAQYGPIAVAIDATHLQHYRGGILTKQCVKPVNHAVIVAGYGPNYWLLKNSWGGRWGEHGYMRLARNHGNLCHVASYGVFPTV
ncbi:hypothetical protein KR222_005639 [Zaprionus bogoriensis]|nr:hypothetical protein KR222_005639 [Zaprionus bogoriensis]